jgi:hypothetical protein
MQELNLLEVAEVAGGQQQQQQQIVDSVRGN